MYSDIATDDTEFYLIPVALSLEEAASTATYPPAVV
jgi:hypothetical protein